MKFSDLDFFILEFSTKSRILETVDSPNSLVVRTVMAPVRLIHPLITSSPILPLRGTLSPVNAAVSSVVLPLTITPSIGTFSPGLTIISIPIATSSGSTCVSSPSTITFA